MGRVGRARGAAGELGGMRGECGPAGSCDHGGLMETSWRVPLLWRVLLVFARVLVFPICRLRVSVEDPVALRGGPLILAANHVSPVDPVIMTAACGVAGIAPRFLATGGIFRAPVAGWVMRRSGHLRVDRGTARAAQALPRAVKMELTLRAGISGVPVLS